MSIRNVVKHAGRWIAGFALVLVVLGFCGCQTAPREQFAELPPSLAGAPAAPAPLTVPAPSAQTQAPATGVAPAAPPALGTRPGLEPQVFRAGDSLTVVYGDLPVTTPPFEGKIKEDGTITLLLNQTFMAAGKMVGALEQEIRERYVPKYYKNLTVTVTPQQSASWYYVLGEVRAPNRQIYTSRLTILQAIASAGGFTDFASKKKVKLTRVDGRTLTVNCVKALEKPTLDLEVYPGDTIHVPRRFL